LKKKPFTIGAGEGLALGWARLGATILSVMVHLLAGVAAVALPSMAPRQPSFYVLAYLIGPAGADGGGASRRDRAAAIRPRPAAASRRAEAAPASAGADARRLKPAPQASDALASASASDAGTHGGPAARDGYGALSGSGRGDGSAGDGWGEGSTEAHPRYAENPAPAYPDWARRSNQQGTVVLRVLVAADGSVTRVEIARSSGFDSLDRSALATVRARWRFVPANRGGLAVASWVLVPIRFALADASIGD
jgi:periplasmic protein TonB